MVQLDEIFASLLKNDVKYLLCGGLAVNLYGIPRMTADIDVLIEWSENNISQFEKALLENGYHHNLPFGLKTLLPIEIRTKYLNERNLIAYSYSSDFMRAISLDVLTITNIDFNACWQRKEIKNIKQTPVYVMAVEDLIAMKQLANREQDKADIINLMKYQKG